MHTAVAQRKRVNFMINTKLLEELAGMVHAGERSDFVNEALEEKIVNWGRRKALELMNESIKKEKKFHTTEEILKVLHADRRY